MLRTRNALPYFSHRHPMRDMGSHFTGGCSTVGGVRNLPKALRSQAAGPSLADMPSSEAEKPCPKTHVGSTMEGNGGLQKGCHIALRGAFQSCRDQDYLPTNSGSTFRSHSPSPLSGPLTTLHPSLANETCTSSQRSGLRRQRERRAEGGV